MTVLLAAARRASGLSQAEVARRPARPDRRSRPTNTATATRRWTPSSDS